MKYSIFVLMSILLSSCFKYKEPSVKPVERVKDANEGARLLEIEFLDFADTLKLDSLKADILNSYDIYDEGNGKIAHIDAEELAEFNFDFFMPSLTKMLDKRGFTLTIQTANGYEETNAILINTTPVQLYTQKELESGDLWGIASKRFFKEVNRQLTRAKIGESFYLLYSDNDLHVLLLTPKQYDAIAEHYKHNQQEIPYLP